MKSAIDENDEEFFSEVENELAKLEKLIKYKETESLFTGEADNSTACRRYACAAYASSVFCSGSAPAYWQKRKMAIRYVASN
ncbi:hypothetical protein NPIL_619971 [Nephila pilipes]|uniref:Uncharacterized protein n=1 Tax=Nephila pilipes TaxID=299642 RepID=A0A8X6PQE5_NEPPI|nr:hypothetical protein NPIL_619971 [Nephila pilipes]